MTIRVTHYGPHPAGYGDTEHKGLREHCTAPDCEARVRQAEEDWGTYCPHGKRIVEKDPDQADDPYQGGRIVQPWPCDEDGCTLEAFEAREKAREDEHWESLRAEVPW